MNGTYFKNPNFPETHNINPYQEVNISILRLNIGKKVKVFPSFLTNREEPFSGIIEAVSEEYLILSNPLNGNWYLIPLKYLDYIEFEEKIIY